MYKKYIPIAIFFLPFAAFAAPGTVDDLLTNFMNILLTVSGFLVPIAILFFFYQLIQFIRASSAGSTSLEKNKAMLIYSGVILFLIVGVFTIVGYIQQSVGTDVTTSDIRETPPVPRDLPL